MSELKWYVVRAVSGQERKVKSYLDNEIARNGMESNITLKRWLHCVNCSNSQTENQVRVEKGILVMLEFARHLKNNL